MRTKTDIAMPERNGFFIFPRHEFFAGMLPERLCYRCAAAQKEKLRISIMSKLRKMLGDINSQECISMMRLIETQNLRTLSVWAIAYAGQNYLEIYQAEYPGDLRLKEAVSACEAYLEGKGEGKEIKAVLKEAGQIARDITDNPTAQAAARAVSTACATIQTPTNALGFLFYGAAAVAYSKEGIAQRTEIYEEVALREWQRALSSLQQCAVPDERQPVKIKWNC